MKKLLASLLAFAMVVTGLYIVKPADVKAATTVDKAMLGVEAAVTADKVDGKYIIRFVSTVDSLNYKNVGFDITYPDGRTETITMKRVFQKIDSSIGAMDNGEEDVFALSPNAISKNSKYFMTTKIVVDNEAGNYTAQAFCTTMDGTKVSGASKCVSVADLQGKTVNVTVPTAFAANATLTATYGDKTAASATVIATGEGYSIVRIQLADNAEAASLKSVTKFTVSDGTTSKDVLYRNYKTSAANGADTSWYDVNPSASEYTIATSADLFGLAKLVNDGVQSFAGKKIYLVSDITVNTGDANGWASAAPAIAWTAIGNETNKFQGTIDGAGNVISGLYSNLTTAGVGFVGYAGSGFQMKNVKFTNSYFKGTAGKVALVAFADSAVIENVYSSAIVQYAGGYSSGFVGNASGNITLKGCWFDGQLIHGGSLGNAIFVGNVATNDTKITIYNCITTGTFSGVGGATHSGNHSSVLIGFANVDGLQIDIKNIVISGTVAIAEGVGRGSITGFIKEGATGTMSNVYEAAQTDLTTLHKVISTAITLTNVQKVEANVLKNLSAAEIKAFLPVLSGESTSAWTTAEDGALVLKAFKAWLYPTAPVADDWQDEPVAPEPETCVPDTSWYNEAQTTFELTKRAELYGLAELAKTNNFAGKTIKLGKNITLNDNINVTAWKTTAPEGTWTPIGSSALPFAGTFDGQGYTLSGLYLNVTTAGAGLFGSTAGTAVIKNFKLVDSYMHSTADNLGVIGAGTFDTMENVYTNVVIETEGNYVGGFVGSLADSGKEIYIKNCWFDGTIAQTTGEIGAVGGFIGVTASVNGDRPIYMMENCLSSGTLSGAQRIGGFIGWHNYGNKNTVSQIVNCLSVANVPASGTKIGMYVGDGNTSGKTTVTTSYTTGTVFGEGSSISAFTYDTANMFKSVSDFTAANLATLFPGSTAWEAVAGSTPILKGFEDKADPAPSTPVVPEPPVAEPLVDTSWYNEAQTTFELTKRSELYGLAELAKTNNFAGKTIKLGKDIALNDNIDVAAWKTTAPERTWTPIGSSALPFMGTFDGQGYTISGLYLNTDVTTGAGFIGYAGANTVIKNFKLVDSYMKSTNGSLGVIGIGQVALCENIYSNAYMVGGNTTGGILGSFKGIYANKDINNSSNPQTVNACWFDGEIEVIGSYSYAGIAGATSDYYYFAYTNCLFTGKITGSATTMVGGIFGFCNYSSNNTIKGCVIAGEINITGGSLNGSVVGDERSSSGTAALTIANTYVVDSELPLYGRLNAPAANQNISTDYAKTKAEIGAASVATLFGDSASLWEQDATLGIPVLKNLK